MLNVLSMIEELDVRLKADEDEESSDLQRAGLPRDHVCQRHLFYLAVLTLDLGDGGVGDELDLGVLACRLDQDGLGAKVLPTVDDVDLLCVARQKDALLQRRVSAADHGDLFLFEKGPVADGALRNAAPLKLALTRDAELLGLAARGQNDVVRRVLSVLGLHDVLRAAPADPGDADGLQVDAELDGLVGHALGEFRPGDVIEPRVVLDRLGVEQLAARGAALEHHGFDPRSSGVQGGGQAGRPSADDDHVVLAVFLHRLRSSHVI